MNVRVRVLSRPTQKLCPLGNVPSSPCTLVSGWMVCPAPIRRPPPARLRTPDHDRRFTSPATAMMTECNGMWSTVKRAGEFNRPVPLSPSSICLALGGGAGDRELTSGERRGLAHVRKKVRVARSHTTTTRSVRSTTALDAPRRPAATS